MLPKRLVGVLLVLAVLLLTGCAGEFITDLYIQDILDVASGEEEYLLTTGTVIIESPGEEFEASLQAILEETFREVKNFRKGSDEYSSKVMADLKVPVLLFDTSLEEPWLEEAMAIVIMPLDDGMSAFGLMLNGEKIDGLFASFLEDAFYSVGVKDFTFFIRLNNDLRGPIPIFLQGVYADGVPYHYEELMELDRREWVELKLGDVARDFAYEEGYVFLGGLEPVE